MPGLARMMQAAAGATAAPSPLLTSLVSYWKLDETSGTRVDSHGSNDLTDNNTVLAAAGKVGNAADLERTNAEYLSHISNADFQIGDNSFTFAFWVKPESLSSSANQLITKDDGATQREYTIRTSTAGGTLIFDLCNGGSVGLARISQAGVFTAGVWTFLVCWYDKAAGKIFAQVNNGGTIYEATLTGTPGINTRPFLIGAGIDANYHDGLVDEVGFWRRVLTADERASLWNGGIGATYPFESQVFTAVLPADLADNSYSTDFTDYYFCSSFARLEVQTDASRLWVKAWTNIYAFFPAWAHVGIWDGTTQTVMSLTADGEGTFSMNLPYGEKTINILAGLQSRPSAGTVTRGTFIKSVFLEGGTHADFVAPSSPATRLLIYGDSIGVGANATYPTHQGWPMLVRQASANSVMVEGWGSRSLHYDANTSGLRAAFVAQVAAANPTTIWLAIGTNDYGLNKWSATDFGTAYAATLDDLHAALPSAAIYAQTPIVRSSEVANSFGNTLGDYRAQISSVCGSRVWATLIDGTAILVTGDLVDGVHPTTAGHDKYADYVILELGL